jgi:hypothetical protein
LLYIGSSGFRPTREELEIHGPLTFSMLAFLLSDLAEMSEFCRILEG